MSLIRVDQRAADFNETLRAATVGEYWALEALAADCLPKLTAFAKARGSEDPEGLASTVMMEFFGRLDQLEFSAAPQMWAYLYRILRSRIIDERRSHKPVEFRENQSIEILLPETAGFDEEIVDRHLVDDLLDQLTTEQREILEMRFLHDLSIEETATRTGRTQTAVKGLQRRAIRSLSTAAAILVVVAFGAAMWAIFNGDNPDNTTISRPVANSVDDGSEVPLEIEADETSSGVSAVSELSSQSVTITEAPEATEETGPSEFRFIAVSDDSASVAFECRVDLGEFLPCVSPKIYQDLAPGNHVFLVRAVDQDDESPSPAIHIWTISGPPDSDGDVIAGDRPLAGEPSTGDTDAEQLGPSTSTPSTTIRPTTSSPATSVKTRQEQLRESSTVYKCGGVSGTYAQLEDKGYAVTIGRETHNRIDVSSGTKPDFVYTFDGDDSITTGPGDDLVCAGSGNDSVSTGEGDDIVSGGSGNDTIDLGAGNDRTWAGGGNDTVQGGSGNDLLRGNDGTDTLNGGGGNDELDGGTGVDILNGSGGEDTCANGIAGDEGDQACEQVPDPVEEPSN